MDNLSQPVHPNGKPSYLSNDVEFFLGDVRNKSDWEKALDGIEIVFHMAAYQDSLPNFSQFFHINAVGTALLYEVIVEKKLNIQKIIVASSQAVYGEGKYRCARCNRIRHPDMRQLDDLKTQAWDIVCDECGYALKPMWTNENRANPQTEYAVSMYSQEIMSFNLGKQYNIPTICLRYSAVQGGRQSIHNPYSGLCRIFCLNMIKGKPLPVFEDGSQQRDFVNIHDVVSANICVMESPKSDYRIFNVGGGKTYTVNEFTNIIGSVFKKNVEIVNTRKYKLGASRHIFSDISKLGELGWKPRFGVSESVTEYLTWIQSIAEIDLALEKAEEEMSRLNIIRESQQIQNEPKIKPANNYSNRRSVKITANH
jgi:dTDP-L-rhamnose 4-epimerase